MAGFRSILARTTIAELLKALTPNDYFQIIQVLTNNVRHQHYITNDITTTSFRLGRERGQKLSDVSQTRLELRQRMCW